MRFVINRDEKVYTNVFEALKAFDEANYQEKNLYLLLDNSEKKLLKRGIYIGNGTNIFTRGYRIFEDEMLYDIRMEAKKETAA